MAKVTFTKYGIVNQIEFADDIFEACVKQGGECSLMVTKYICEPGDISSPIVWKGLMFVVRVHSVSNATYGAFDAGGRLNVSGRMKTTFVVTLQK